MAGLNYGQSLFPFKENEQPKEDYLENESKAPQNMFYNGMFIKRGEILANYDYRDLIRGSGYIEFFGGATLDNDDNVKYILNTERFDSLDFSSSGAGTYHTAIPASSTNEIMNFDAEVGATFEIKGKILMEIMLNAENNRTLTIVATLQKIRGVSTTDIIQIANYDYTIGITGTDHNEKRFCFAEDITTKHKFISGDTLRLKLDITTGSSNGGSYRVYHDPNNRDGITKKYNNPTADGDPYQYKQKSELKLNIPFSLSI